MIPHGDVSAAPTMAAFMLVLQSLQAQNQAILTRLDSIDATNQQRHGELHTEITSKADSTDITRLDHLLADVTTQLTPVTASILDIKANLSHVMTTHAAKLDKLDTMIDDQQACMDSYSTSFNERFAALERLLSSPPDPRARLWLIPPSEGATAQRANFLPQSCPRVVLSGCQRNCTHASHPTSDGVPQHHPGNFSPERGPHRGAPRGQHIHSPEWTFWFRLRGASNSHRDTPPG